MRRHGLLCGSVLFTVSTFLSACGGHGGPLVHRMEVVIGANVPTIAEGELEAALYAYDPTIADKPADTLDQERVPLSHTRGAVTRATMTLTGQVPRGFRTYVSVNGYERQGDTLERVLWDGQEGTGMPTRVEMRPLLDEAPPEAAQLAESLLDWQVLKETHSSAYEYDVVFASWIGSGSITTLDVRDDEVVKRTHEARDPEGKVTESWTEEGVELGSHEGGAPLRTVEALYAVCGDEVLTQDRTENDIFLEFHDDGVLKQCEYFPKNCADDCFVGVSIDGLRFLETDIPPFALTLDESAYAADCTDDQHQRCTFTVEASYHNRTEASVYLQRCYPDSEHPIFGVSTLDGTMESAYGPVWACVGHEDHIRVAPGETRIDVLEISGPNSFDGVTGEPFGVTEGVFQLGYDAYPCAEAEAGSCDRLPETQRVSAPFKVTVGEQSAEGSESERR